jgi:CubicO group peptidase (beta-lactamase class C family)
MVRFLIPVLAVLVGGAGGCAPARPCVEASRAPAAPAAAAPDLRRFDEVVRGAVADWGVPGLAIAVVKDDSVVFAAGYGVRRLGGSERVDPETLFGFLSPTKGLAAAAAGVLVDEGRMGWNDRVVDHLPWFRVSDPAATRAIRVRDLVSHGTGYQDDHRLWHGRGGTTAQVARRAEQLRAVAEPGTAFHYNNVMYVVAGEVLEAASGDSWDALVRDRLFAPLGMERSTTSVAELASRDNVASPHARRVFGRLGPVRPIEYLDIDNIGPAGSVHTSVAEAARWLRMLLNDGVYEGRQILSPETVRTLGRAHVPFPPGFDARIGGDRAFAPLCGYVDFGSLSYGLGWFVMSYRGRHTLMHGGGINGQRSAVALLPGQRVGVVVLSNLQDTEIALALAWQALDLFLDVEPRDWSAAYREGRAASP